MSKLALAILLCANGDANTNVENGLNQFSMLHHHRHNAKIYILTFDEDTGVTRKQGFTS